MHIENHKEEVPFSYYADLFAQADHAEISARLDLPFENGAFSLRLLGKTYTVTHPASTVTGADDGAVPPLPVQTFLLRWLLEGKLVPWQGQWKTFREMPWGELYIQPYTGRVLTRAAYTFATRLAAFRAACEKLGAAPVPNGDAGYELEFLPGMSMRILLWEADEEFPPSAQVLYTDNFADALAPEDRVVAGDLLIGRVKAAM